MVKSYKVDFLVKFQFISLAELNLQKVYMYNCLQATFHIPFYNSITFFCSQSRKAIQREYQEWHHCLLSALTSLGHTYLTYQNDCGCGMSPYLHDSPKTEVWRLFSKFFMANILFWEHLRVTCFRAKNQIFL